MKYGKYEYERTYLLDSDCLVDKEIIAQKELIDIYFLDTRLRLRQQIENDELKYKLTKKEELHSAKAGIKKINTLYLSEIECKILSKIEGIKVKKMRYIIKINKHRIGIDKILINGQNIYLGEVEFDSESEMSNFIMPLKPSKEITNIKEYNGFELAKKYADYT